MTSRTTELRGRAAVLGRVVLAAGGGYGVAALATTLLSLTLPLPRAEAVTTATLASFAVMVGVVVSVFAARSLARAALGTGGAALVLGAALWLVMGHNPA
ncbi:iron transporter [Methylobacterium oryzihabitans]|uniref:Iron transporter n=1 Tax=Methylobacterium oryzihabitans TaxID=2499852 RepID=A0A3S2VSR2_9HYPH|nr:iron transporter [Methylobacterium oryzihabitans]RVU16337.1 iron transporter [Methylobacterium oryzihabitans]